jgi:hypothetical protein
MDAIRTTTLKQTESRQARIKASTPRGSVSIPHPKVSELAAHAFAAQVACKRLYPDLWEDLTITTGRLADGSYVHVITNLPHE